MLLLPGVEEGDSNTGISTDTTHPKKKKLVSERKDM